MTEHEAALGIAVPPLLAQDFLSKLHYVSENLVDFSFASDARDRVRFRLRDASGEKAVAAAMAETAQKMCARFKEFRPKVLLNKPVTGKFAADPHPLLEAAGELTRYGSGRYGIGPKLSALIEYFDRELVACAKHFDAPPHQFPSLIGADTLERCQYIKSFPHSLNLVSHLREELTAIQSFARDAKWNGENLNVAPGSLAGVKTLLSPSVCFHWYAGLAGQKLDTARTITARGKCFRYESGNLTGLERLWDFTMREIIFVGPKDWVLAQRQKSIDVTAERFDAWELGYEVVSAMDPFFIEDFAAQSAFQMAFDLKFEIRPKLPYKNGSLAAGSYNHHQSFFGTSFQISDAQGKPVNTGCAGWGLERLALAFVAQHGIDSKAWPKAVREGIS